MYHDFFTSKWVIGGFAFLIVFGVACVFWYHYDTAPYKRDAVETANLTRQWQNSKLETHDNEITKKSLKNNISSAEKSGTETGGGILGRMNTEVNPSNMSDETHQMESSELIPVSPHGFGPFPDVPDDYIIQPFSWDFYKNDPPIYELMERVRMKLWKQGIRATGMLHANGLVYPTIPGTVFVKKYNRDGDDFIEIRGSPKDNLESITKSLLDGVVPSGIQLRDMDEAGIDPYKFLNLTK